MAIGDGVSAIASLAVTFGGFSPTAMDGVEATREQVERLEAELARKRALARKARELELARTSQPRSCSDSNATVWTYVVIDERAVRIVKCETAARSVTVPESIEGLPVYSLGPDACAYLESVEEIVCPDSLESIGSCAFRFCPNLRKVALPANIAEFSGSWFQQCSSLEEMRLPGLLDTLGPAIFENPGLRRLIIGKSVREIEPGSFQKSHLEELVIDEDNPFIKTDGTAIYSMDGKTLLVLAKPVSRYAICEGCQVLAKKSCYGIERLEEALVPDTVEVIGPFAFSHSGIRSFTAPGSLRVIEEKAFYHCRQLETMNLNRGLSEIGNSAFEESGLVDLVIPASIESIGSSITARTRICHSGPACSLSIDPASELLFLDGQGGLYRREGDGAHLVQLLDREASRYTVFDGAVAIDDFAFAYHDHIERIVVPEGVVRIGASAFRFCTRLTQVTLPDSVASIGDDAFLDTALERLRIPESLDHLGANALVTRGAHHGEAMPSLRSIEVAAGNNRFFVVDGMLCRRGEAGDSVVVFTSSSSSVKFPESIVAVEPYAFNNARGIAYLSLDKSLKSIGTAGLATWCWIEHIHIEVEQPIEERTEFDFKFPDIPKSVHGISLGIGGASWVNVPGIMAQYDNCVVNAHDYNSPRNPDSISIYEQVSLIVSRLRDPVLLTNVSRSMYERVLRNHVIEICVDIARHDDRPLIDSLVELGYLNADNLEDAIIAVGKLQDAAMTGYLLELKRRRFRRDAFDFDL